MTSVSRVGSGGLTRHAVARPPGGRLPARLLLFRRLFYTPDDESGVRPCRATLLIVAWENCSSSYALAAARSACTSNADGAWDVAGAQPPDRPRRSRPATAPDPRRRQQAAPSSPSS